MSPGFLPVRSERSSSERSPLDTAEILRDAPLYPPLRDNPDTSRDNPSTLVDSPGKQVSNLQTPSDNPGTLSDNDENIDKSIINPINPDSKDFQPFFDTNYFDEDSIDNTDVNELTGVNYDDMETSIEDSSILVTPDETVLENLNESKDKEVNFDKSFSSELNLQHDKNINKDSVSTDKFPIPDENMEEKVLDVDRANKFETDVISKSNIAPEDYNDMPNVPQVLEPSEKTLDISDTNSNTLLENGFDKPESGFIVAPGSNVDELNRILMAEEARVEAESKRFADNSENSTRPSIYEDEAYVTDESFDRKKRSSTDWDKPSKVRLKQCNLYN